MTMTIKELLEKQTEAEKKIVDILNEFEKETGVTVKDVEIQYGVSSGGYTIKSITTNIDLVTPILLWAYPKGKRYQ